MSHVAIRAAGLGKRYRLGEPESYQTLRDTFARLAKAPFRRRRTVRRPGEGNHLWALRNVSFEVPCGEALGIIGRNGAGKSTLLKVLSRITEPTAGYAEICGRVASLLEVGTGFHPELTGRENVFLYGAIMGMTRSQIVAKFDEIVEFAEVEKFVDTPVKRYSSGMYTRLAFSVAAHLEPEILVVDEVLAVGDMKFQKKCLGKMSDVASQHGRTVLFVSHNMDAVRRLCDRAIWLDEGRIRDADTAAHCVSSYLMSGVAEGGRVVFDPPRTLGNRMPLRLLSAQVTDGAGCFQPVYSTASPLELSIEWQNTQTLYRPRLGFVLQTEEGLDVLTTFDATAWRQERTPPGRRVSTCRIPAQLLNEGQYVIDIGGDGWADTAQSRVGFAFQPSRTGPVLRFEVEDNSSLPSKNYGQYGPPDVRWPGVLLMDLPWEQTALEALSPAA